MAAGGKLRLPLLPVASASGKSVSMVSPRNTSKMASGGCRDEQQGCSLRTCGATTTGWSRRLATSRRTIPSPSEGAPGGFSTTERANTPTADPTLSGTATSRQTTSRSTIAAAQGAVALGHSERPTRSFPPATCCAACAACASGSSSCSISRRSSAGVGASSIETRRSSRLICRTSAAVVASDASAV